MRWRTLIILLNCTFLFSDCVIIPIPTPETKILSGEPVKNEQLSFIKPGITTIQEVINNLGQPDIVWEDAHILIYKWEMRQGILFWVAGAYYTGDMGTEDIPKHHLLLIQFDEQNILLRFEHAIRPWHKPLHKFLQEWKNNYPLK